jgi:transcriptional regulator with GAF, ATPase, and Fis domain
VAFAGWRLRLQDTLAPSSVTLGPRPAAVELMGDSEPMERLREQVERVSASGLPVLIQGETGTGKELVARSVHRSSGRRGPFVPINCGALSPQLAESELFGHERGAFTGADRARDGAFARADRGTVFLDELGELPLALQAKLLRVLQERAVRRVGGDRVQPVDFRLVCATHRDLRAMVGSGKFREDLWFRVAVGTLDVPPLRERGADVLQLARHFLQAVGGRADWLDAEARKHLVTHPWPGNVRELKNAIERAVVLGSGPLRPEDLHLGQPLPREREPQDVPRLPPPRRRRALQVRDVVAALERSGGNRAAAARELGIARSTLYERLQAMREREE